MRKKLRIEEQPEIKPENHEATVEKLAARLAEWATMADTEPMRDEQHAG